MVAIEDAKFNEEVELIDKTVKTLAPNPEKITYDEIQTVIKQLESWLAENQTNLTKRSVGYLNQRIHSLNLRCRALRRGV